MADEYGRAAMRRMTMKNELGLIGDLSEAVGELRNVRGALERFGQALGEVSTSVHERAGSRDDEARQLVTHLDAACDWVGEAYDKLGVVRRLLLSEVDRLELEMTKRYRDREGE